MMIIAQDKFHRALLFALARHFGLEVRFIGDGTTAVIEDPKGNIKTRVIMAEDVGHDICWYCGSDNGSNGERRVGYYCYYCMCC